MTLSLSVWRSIDYNYHDTISLDILCPKFFTNKSTNILIGFYFILACHSLIENLIFCFFSKFANFLVIQYYYYIFYCVNRSVYRPDTSHG